MADVAGSFGAAFQGALSGFKGGLDIANQQQLQTLRDRDQKMQEFKTFGDISKEYANDPDMGKILISDLGKRLGLTEDEIKSKHQFLSALNEERLRAVTSLAYQAGVDPNSMPLKDIMKMPNLDLAKYLQDQGTKQSGQRVAGIEAGTPGTSPTPEGAIAGAGGTPATAAPVSAPGAMSPASPVQQGATPGAAIRPEQIAMLESGGNAAARNPRSTASGQYQITDQTRDDFANRYGIDRGNDDAIMRLKTAEDHKIFTQQHGRPATAAEGAMQWRFGGTGGAKIAAADPNTPIEKLVTPDVMQANPDLAGKTAGQVKGEIEGKLGGTQQATATGGPAPAQPPAPATTTSAGAIKVPAPDGTDISLPANAMTRSAIVARDTVNDIQTRIDRLNKALADPNSKVQDRSGLLARVDKLQAERKSLEGNAVVTLPPGSSAKFGSNKVGDIVSYNLITGKIEFPMQGQEKETELTPTERIEAGVDPGKVVTRTASGAIKVAEVGKDKEQLLGKAEMDAEAARGVPIDRTEVYSKNLTTGAVRPVSTLTSERTRSRLLAEHDIKTLTDLRAARTTANEQLGHSAVIKALGDITPTGALGNIQLNLSKLAEAAGWNPTRIKGLYDPAQGEVLRSELGKSVITQLAGPEGLKGASSDKELNFASNNAGSLLTTPKGIQWMQDLKEYKAKNVHKIADLADSWDGGSGDLSKQATSGPYKGMTFHQARGQIESEGAIPKEFVDRLHQAVGDAPDPKKISWWNRPISELNPLEVKRMSVEGIDKLNEDQLVQLRSRAVELGLNKGQ
jgi:hypothetical protein